MAKLPGAVLFACTLNAIRSPMAEAMLGAAGLTLDTWHTDAAERFALVLATPAVTAVRAA